MDLNKLLQMTETDELPELKDENFPDEEQRLYRAFLDKVKNDKITIPLIYSDALKNIKFLKKNPHLIEAMKKHFQDQFDKNPNKSKGKFEQVQINGEQFLEQIPFLFFVSQSSRVQVLNLLAQKKHSIRDIIYDLFPLYQDDEIELTIKFHGKAYVKVSGPVKTLTVPTEDIMNMPIRDQSKDVQMLTVEIKLLKTSDFRRRHEESSNIFDLEKEKSKLLSKEHQVEMFMNGLKRNKFPKEQFFERAKLFNLTLDANPETWESTINQLTPIDFGAKKMTDLRDIMISFYHIDTNEKMMKFKLRLDLELKKMESWLNRKDPDGKNGYFK